MGLGFVLIIWLIILVALAIPTSATLCLLTRRFSKSATKNLLRRRIVIAGVVPFAMIAYFGFAFIAYGSWCLLVRNVDPGIGDGWVVPVGNDYTMEMIDIPENASIHMNNETYIKGIKLVGKMEPYVFGRSADGYFILNVSSGELCQSESEHSFREKLKERGVLKTDILETPGSFYQRNRWGIADLMFALIVFFIPAIGLYPVWTDYWRMPKHVDASSS